jgi:hypothetical protein
MYSPGRARSRSLNKKRTVVDHLLQDEGAASAEGSFLRARERLAETLWQFDLWPTYRVIALPIVEIEEKERTAKSTAKEKGCSRR